MVRAIHAESMAMFGGLPGLLDQSVLESACHKPRNLWTYGDAPSLFDLAAAYCFGIVRNHPFADGNKRAGLLVARAFLFLNGYLFEPEETDEVNVIVALAAGEMDETELGKWFSDNSLPRRR